MGWISQRTVWFFTCCSACCGFIVKKKLPPFNSPLAESRGKKSERLVLHLQSCSRNRAEAPPSEAFRCECRPDFCVLGGIFLLTRRFCADAIKASETTVGHVCPVTTPRNVARGPLPPFPIPASAAPSRPILQLLWDASCTDCTGLLCRLKCKEKLNRDWQAVSDNSRGSPPWCTTTQSCGFDHRFGGLSGPCRW